MNTKENTAKRLKSTRTRRGIQIALAIIPVVGVIAGAMFANWDKIFTNSKPPGPTPTIEPKIEVQSAAIVGIKAVSPGICIFEKPCSSLKRGSELNIKLTKAGYAVAFLQDQGGNYFTQNGRPIVANATEGSAPLWPGTDKSVAHRVFKLWVVTSTSKMATSSDSTALEELPVGTNGQTWGPVYLETDSR